MSEPSNSQVDVMSEPSNSQASDNKAQHSKSEPDEVERWIDSMEIMMGSLMGSDGSPTDEKVKACTIFEVPKQLRKSEKEAEAYKPKVVFIGPLHRTNRDLLYMQEIKYHCMLSLLVRTNDAKQMFRKCSKAILELDEVVRVFYVDDIKLNNYDLAKIMLLDGCFLLELLISKACESCQDVKSLVDEDIKLDLSHNSDSDPAADVRKMPEVISDLKLLENQIPFLVLINLFQLLNPDKTYNSARNMVNSLALSFFGCSPTPTTCSKTRAHLLDLLHSYITEKEQSVEESKHHSINIKISERRETSEKKETSGRRKYKTKSDRKCCFARLLAAGILLPKEYRRSVEQSHTESIVFGCHKSFSNETLEIQPLHITEETKIQWQNLIAWEQNRTINQKYIAQSQNKTHAKLSEYALLFKALVCCEHDVKLLKDRNVIVVHDEKKNSNEDLKVFFDTIADGINEIDAGVDHEFMINLEERARDKILFWHGCRRFLTNGKYTLRTWFVTLKRDHTTTVWKTIGVFAAIVLLLLTVAQTVLTAIGL